MKLHATYLYIILECAAKESQVSQKDLASAILAIVAYNFGYEKPNVGAIRSIKQWTNKLKGVLHEQQTLDLIVANQKLGPQTGKNYERMEKASPMWLHFLF